MPMTREERELSRKLLNTQAQALTLEEQVEAALFAVAQMHFRLRTLEAVVEGMCVGKRSGSGSGVLGSE